ncbi:MFS general substrate transporter [Ramaria rubella]|nr:MFS general substrate transporter [Ramaria rubella]
MSSGLHYGTVNSTLGNDLDDGTNRSLDPRHRRRSRDTRSRSRHSHVFQSRSPMARLSGDLGEQREQDPFLPPRSRSSSPSTASTLTNEEPRRRKSTLWLLPIVFLAGFSRGMTMAPRIEVYTQIACDDIHPSLTSPPPLSPNASLSFPLTLSDFHLASPLMFDSTIPPTLLYTPQSIEMVHRDEKDNFHVATPSDDCLRDPAVQSRAAGIQATLGTIVGVLSIITAGYWGQISDAFGRKTVLSLILFGMTFHDIIYIMVSIPNSVFKRHAWGFLVLGPVVEGSLGGLTTLHAAEHAFQADFAQSGSRATVFAYFQGASYIALASGPQIAGIFLPPSADVRTIMFYSGLACHVIGLCYALFILPESVSPEMMQIARHGRNSGSEPDRASIKTKEKWARKIRDAQQRLLAPLTIFGPKRKPDGGWDLNMTFLVIAQFTHLMSVGVVQVKFLYAQHKFAWSVQQLSYYISLLWILRAFHLLLLLPTIVRFIKPKPLYGINTSQALSQDMRFDYRIAQFSIFIDTMAYVLTTIAPAASAVLFVCFTSLSSFTAGVNPAIHSLAVSYLLAQDGGSNVGQMFGAMSMLQAVSNTLQPLLFGLVYSETVATYPKAIFVLAAGLLISSSALFTLLSTNVTPHADAEAVSVGEGEYDGESQDIGENRGLLSEQRN